MSQENITKRVEQEKLAKYVRLDGVTVQSSSPGVNRHQPSAGSMCLVSFLRLLYMCMCSSVNADVLINFFLTGHQRSSGAEQR